jgi:hypothetical protein
MASGLVASRKQLHVNLKDWQIGQAGFQGLAVLERALALDSPTWSSFQVGLIGQGESFLHYHQHVCWKVYPLAWSTIGRKECDEDYYALTMKK